jgi:hypothetical protein
MIAEAQKRVTVVALLVHRVPDHDVAVTCGYF